MSDRHFPILRPWRRGEVQSVESIPWSIAELAYVEYRRRYGNWQSLERIAERGGFGESELDVLLPRWRKLLAERPGDAPR